MIVLHHLNPRPAMSLLAQVAVNTKPSPPKMIVYGEHGVGKTTFACSAPKPIVIRTEDRLGLIKVPAFPLARDFGGVINAIRALVSEPHDYKTVVLDTADWLEPLVWSHTALLGGKSSIEDWGFGKGYLEADEHWRTVLRGLSALSAKGMLVIVIAHSQIRRFDSPETEPYDRYILKLHNRANALLAEWADIIGFARFEVFTESKDTGFNKTVTRGVGTGRRMLALEKRPAFDAKNSYNLPAEIPLDWPTFRAALTASFAAANAAYEDAQQPSEPTNPTEEAA